MTDTHNLPGLDPSRLSTYLAGVGLAKVVARQRPELDVALGWSGRRFQLRTATELDLATFLVEDYEPTPVVSPWNGGSGFQPQDKTSARFVSRLADSEGPRLDGYRTTIEAVRVVTGGTDRAVAWTSVAIKKDKARYVQALRNELPDAALDWLDAAVVLRLDVGDPAFPILLGTGGNDGRLDFSSNFHQRLCDVLPELGGTPERSRGWATDMLTGSSTTPQVRASIGMYDPLGAGGPESSPRGDSASLVNPWVYVLMVEGLAAFASGAARRLGSTRSRAAMPFMVDGGPGAGLPGAPNENVRGEFWAPLTPLVPWRAFTQLIRDARASWDGSAVTSAVQMYGAARTFGVDRGIQAFHRFVLAELNGLAYSAILRDRVRVEREAGAELMAAPLRHAEVLARVDSKRLARSYRKVEGEVSGFLSGATVPRLITSLAALARLEIAATSSESGRDNLRGLDGPRPSAAPIRAWVAEPSQDLPAEVLIAASIASAVAVRADGSGTVPVRELLMWSRPEKNWLAPRVRGLGGRSLVDVLADLGVWLAQHQPTDRDRVERGFAPLVFHKVRPPTEHVHAWALGLLDDALVEEAFLAMLVPDWRWTRPEFIRGRRIQPVVSPPLAILRAFAAQRVVMPGQPATDDAKRRGLDQAWMTQLRAGHVAPVVDGARTLLRRHRVLVRTRAQSGESLLRLGQVHLGDAPTPSIIDAALGKRLTAALLVGSGWSDLGRVANVGPQPDIEILPSEGEAS
jgi:CRISPR-associated protein Csx17